MIKSRKIRWATHVARLGTKRVLVGKPEGKKPLERRRHKSDNNVKRGIKK